MQMEFKVMPINLRNKFAAGATLILCIVTLIPTTASADRFVEHTGGYTHTFSGNHGETFVINRDYNSGKSTTVVDKNDGRGFQPFVAPPPLKVTKRSSASLYDPYTNKTTTKVLFAGGGSATIVEDGNTLSKR
jgi:hypothetical protein